MPHKSELSTNLFLPISGHVVAAGGAVVCRQAHMYVGRVLLEAIVEIHHLVTTVRLKPPKIYYSALSKRLFLRYIFRFAFFRWACMPQLMLAGSLVSGRCLVGICSICVSKHSRTVTCVNYNTILFESEFHQNTQTPNGKCASTGMIEFEFRWFQCNGIL